MARTPPSFVSSASTSFTSTTTPKSLGVTVQTGDLIVVGGLSEDNGSGLTVSGGGLTWTRHVYVEQSSHGNAGIWTAVATSNTTVTVQMDRNTEVNEFGFNVQVWRGHGGTGAVASTYSSSDGTPALTFSTANDNSAIAVFNADWDAEDGTTRTWRTAGTAATETAYARNSATYTAYCAYHTDAGTAGSKTVGLTAPGSQQYSIVALEILGAAVSPTGIAGTYATGTPAVSYGPVTLTPTGIPGAYATGTPTVATTNLAPTGIAAPDPFENNPGPVVSVDTWRQIIERDWWETAVTRHQRTIGYRAIMVDPKGIQVGEDIPITGGNVDQDGDSAEMWAASITVAGKEWIPRKPTDPLDPRSGLRCQIYWRLLINGGWVEIPIGAYYLENPKISDDGPVPVITLEGRDPISLIRRLGYGNTVVSVGGLTVPAALDRIFTRLLPDQPVKIESSSGVTLPAVYELTGKDPLEDITDIAAQAGLAVWTDREGVIVCAPAPEPNTIRADWQEGEDCPVLSMSRDMSTSGMINSVTVVSTNPEVLPPISVTVEDDDPSSPTWVEGPFRRRSEIIRADSVATEEGAESFARAVLNSKRRPTESITVEVPGRGDLNFMDQVRLRRDAINVASPYRIRKWSLPITGAAQAPPTMTVTMMTRSI